jgi:hypothetical protein
MKGFLVNLLILFSLALCGFNAYQWYREAQFRTQLRQKSDEIYRQTTELQSQRLSLEANAAEITRLEALREGLAVTIRSNRSLVTQLQEESDQFRRDAQSQASRAEQIEKQYKVALDQANLNLKEQNEIIRTQNERLKQVADDRNEIVGRYNKLADDYKTLGADYTRVLGLYTNLVAQVQAANQKAAR